MNRILSISILLAVLFISKSTDAQDRGWAASIAWSPDGETIAIGSTTGIWFFDNDFAEVGHVQVQQGEGEPARSLAWNASGDLLAVGYPRAYAGGPIQIIDVRKREVISEFRPTGNFGRHFDGIRARISLLLERTLVKRRFGMRLPAKKSSTLLRQAINPLRIRRSRSAGKLTTPS